MARHRSVPVVEQHRGLYLLDLHSKSDRLRLGNRREIAHVGLPAGRIPGRLADHLRVLLGSVVRLIVHPWETASGGPGQVDPAHVDYLLTVPVAAHHFARVCIPAHDQSQVRAQVVCQAGSCWRRRLRRFPAHSNLHHRSNIQVHGRYPQQPMRGRVVVLLLPLISDNQLFLQPGTEHVLPNVLHGTAAQEKGRGTEGQLRNLGTTGPQEGTYARNYDSRPRSPAGTLKLDRKASVQRAG